MERVAGDLYLLRVDDTAVRYFEAMWEVPEGVTYNAYLLLTAEGAVLFDGWKREFGELFAEAVGRVADLRDIRVAVVHHAEPDHSGTAGLVAEAAPRATFVGHPVAGRILRSHYGIERFKPVADGEALEIGGVRLRFVHAPWLHWPDTIVTAVEGEGLLLTCDIFGSYSTPPPFDDQTDLAQLSRYVRKYVVTVIGHYIDWVPKGVERVRAALPGPRVIAPAHGTVYRSRPSWVVEEYLRVASGQPERGKAVLVGVSAYGNVGRALEALGEALRARGWRVVEYLFTDRERPPASEVLTDASDAELLALGVSTYEASAHPLAEHLAKLIAWKLPHRRSMPLLVLSSYGWAPAGKRLLELLRSQGFTSVKLVEFEGRLFERGLEEALAALPG